MDGEYAVYQIERPGWIHYHVRAANLKDAESFVDQITDEIGTLMVDTSDWRFVETPRTTLDRDRIVDIYAEEG